MSEDETTITLDEALSRLSASYDLVYVAYDQELSRDQTAALVRGDNEGLWLDPYFSDWENDSRWDGIAYVISDTFSDEEWESLSEGDKETVREAIQERESGDWFTSIVRHTSDPLLRVECVDEDHAWSFEPVDAAIVLAAVGLDATPHNVKTVDAALAECSPEFSVLMGYWIFSADLETIAALPEDCTVEVTNPHLYLGNPFAGSGWVTDDPLEGVVTIKREDLRADRDAFGYSVDEIYGGLSASNYESDIRVAESVAESEVSK